MTVSYLNWYVYMFFYEYKIKLSCCHDVQSPSSFHVWVQSTWQGVRKYPEYFDRNTELAVKPHNLEVIKRSECYVCHQLGTTGCEGSRFGLPRHFSRSLCGCLTFPFIFLDAQLTQLTNHVKYTFILCGKILSMITKVVFLNLSNMLFNIYL